MLTRVLERARWSSCSYCITGGIRELPFRPGTVTGAAVSVVGSGANLLRYLSAPRLALWSSPTVTRFPSRRVTASWAESCGGSGGRDGENTWRRANRGENKMFIWGLSGNGRVWLFLCVSHHFLLILPLRSLHLNDCLVQRSELRVHSTCCVETGSHVFSSKISGFCWRRALTWLADWAVICLLRRPLTSDGLYCSSFRLSSQVVRGGVDHTTCFCSWGHRSNKSKRLKSHYWEEKHSRQCFPPNICHQNSDQIREGKKREKNASGVGWIQLPKI